MTSIPHASKEAQQGEAKGKHEEVSTGSTEKSKMGGASLGEKAGPGTETAEKGRPTGEKVKEGVEQVKESAGATAEETQKKVGEGLEAVEGKAGGAKEYTGAVLGEASKEMSKHSQESKEEAYAALSDVAKRANELASSMRSSAGSTYEEAREAAAKISEDLSHAISKLHLPSFTKQGEETKGLHGVAGEEVTSAVEDMHEAVKTSQSVAQSAVKTAADTLVAAGDTLTHFAEVVGSGAYSVAQQAQHALETGKQKVDETQACIQKEASEETRAGGGATKGATQVGKTEQHVTPPDVPSVGKQAEGEEKHEAVKATSSEGHEAPEQKASLQGAPSSGESEAKEQTTTVKGLGKKSGEKGGEKGGEKTAGARPVMESGGDVEDVPRVEELPVSSVH